MGCSSWQGWRKRMFCHLPSGDEKRAFWHVFCQEICTSTIWLFWLHPPVGASGGILVIWNSSILRGDILDKRSYGITIQFTSAHSNKVWKLTNVYGPCAEPARTEFVTWFREHDITDEENWIFLGDFNFYRSLSNRNKPGGNLADTLVFNDAIGHLGLVELPLKGRAFTWSNIQSDPLLE